MEEKEIYGIVVTLKDCCLLLKERFSNETDAETYSGELVFDDFEENIKGTQVVKIRGVSEYINESLKFLTTKEIEKLVSCEPDEEIYF